MTSNRVFRIVGAIILVVGLIGIGIYIYQAGVAHGMAGIVQIESGETGKGFPNPAMPPNGTYPFGFGFFGWLIPLFFILMFFWALRAIFGCMPHLYHGFYWSHPAWRAFHRMGRNEEWSQVVPPFFEEWHRKAHEGQTPAGTEEKEA